MTRRPALSLNLYLDQRAVLLVGSGDGADERASRLAGTGAVVTRLTEADWHAKKTSLKPRFYLVISHSTDDELNTGVATWAREHSMLGYAHDQPACSDFSFPALSKRGPIQFAVSTQGAAPALASQLRKEIDSLFERSGDLIDALVNELETVRRDMPRGAQRMEKLKRIARRLKLKGRFYTDS